MMVELTAQEEREIEEKYGLIPPAPADDEVDDAAIEAKYGMLKEGDPQPAWLAFDGAAAAKEEQLREGVTLPRAAAHVGSGTLSGLGDTLNLPKTMSDITRGGTEWVANKLPGVDNFELPSQALPTGMPGAFLFNEQPASTTDLLKKLPGGETVAGWSQPKLSQAEIEGSDLGAAADMGRTAAEWFQPAGIFSKAEKLSKIKPDAIMAALAAFGKYVGDEPGELIGGGLGILNALRTGDFSKISKADEEAMDFVLASADEGADIAADVATRDAAGEIGTLGDLARDRGVFNIQKTLESSDQPYKTAAGKIAIARDQQIADQVTIPFRRVEGGTDVVPMRPEIDPVTGVRTPDATIEAAKTEVDYRRRVIEQAMEEDVAEIAAKAEAAQAGVAGRMDEVASREMPTADPEIAIAQQKAQAAQMQADEVAQAQDLADTAEGKLVPLRADNAIAGTPPSRSAEIFEGVDMTNPEAMQDAQDIYWSGPKAFQEVKDKSDFVLDGTVLEDIKQVLDVPEVRVELGGYLDEVAERARRARGLPFPDTMAEDFNKADYIESVLSGKIDGTEMMALRNWFATRAADPALAGTKLANSGVKTRLEAVIMDQLDEAGQTAFIEQMAAYPAYLSNQRLMVQVATQAAFGEYTPLQQLQSGKPFGYPSKEPNRQLNRELNQTREGLEKATAAETRASAEAAQAEKATVRAETRVERAEKAQARDVKALETEAAKVESAAAAQVKKAETAAGRESLALDKTQLAEYSKAPQTTLKKLIGREDGASSLKRLYESMTDLGQRENFRMEVGRALSDSIGTSGGKKILKKSADDFANLRKTLLDAGVLDGDGVQEITAALDKSITRELSTEISQKSAPVTDSEAHKVVSSVLAALAVNATPVTGGSLILAGTFKRAMNKFVRKVANREEVVESLKEITSDPKKFLELIDQAKNEKEAIRLFFTPLVGAAQAQRLADEMNED